MLLGGENTEPILQPARPWKTSFFGTFSLPKDKNDIIKRLESNVLFYQSNYLIITMIVAFFNLLTKPIALLLGPCVGAMFYVAFYKKSNDIEIGKIRLSKNVIIIGISIVVMALILLSGAYFNLFASYIMSSLIILSHLVFRDRNIRSKLDITSTGTKIFDPDEMLRRSAQSQFQAPSAQFSNASVTSASGTSYQPPASTAAPPTTTWAPPVPAAADENEKAARKEKQKLMRQRIKEQYGMSKDDAATTLKKD
ncbi:hypothetical protein AKO1_011006 [Acrasis kona]|uniref:PRA1 family protein n=1 Tax=Acrasis kona TaxID=1008807 RepID=A0AAW2YTC5_9EUKA